MVQEGYLGLLHPARENSNTNNYQKNSYLGDNLSYLPTNWKSAQIFKVIKSV